MSRNLAIYGHMTQGMQGHHGPGQYPLTHGIIFIITSLIQRDYWRAAKQPSSNLASCCAETFSEIYTYIKLRVCTHARINRCINILLNPRLASSSLLAALALALRIQVLGFSQVESACCYVLAASDNNEIGSYFSFFSFLKIRHEHNLRVFQCIYY